MTSRTSTLPPTRSTLIFQYSLFTRNRTTTGYRSRGQPASSTMPRGTDADGSDWRETDKHGSLVRRPGKVMPGSLRGCWRTTATSARAAKLFWQDLLSRSTGGTRTRVRTPKKSKGEDTLSALEWGHSLGSWVRTLSRLLVDDTHSSAPGWSHPLSSWVRTPTLHPFRRPIDDMWPVSETSARLELSA